MRAGSKERLIRLFISSILKSDLSVTEIREVADELERGSFSHELRQILMDLARNLRGAVYEKSQTSDLLDHMSA